MPLKQFLDRDYVHVAGGFFLIAAQMRYLWRAMSNNAAARAAPHGGSLQLPSPF